MSLSPVTMPSTVTTSPATCELSRPEPMVWTNSIVLMPAMKVMLSVPIGVPA